MGEMVASGKGNTGLGGPVYQSGFGLKIGDDKAVEVEVVEVMQEGTQLKAKRRAQGGGGGGKEGRERGGGRREGGWGLAGGVEMEMDSGFELA